MRPAIKIVLGVAAVSAVIAGRIVLPGRSAPAAAPDTAPAVPVVAAPVQQGDVPIVVSGLGTVQALNTAVIRSQVTGLLQSVNFTEGQHIHRGDLLAQVDPRPAQ